MINRWRYPWFEGRVREPVPDPSLPVALGARSYVIEPKEYQRQFISDLRESTDNSNEPTESAFNPETTWRRGGSSWHLGCGQRDFDLEDEIDQRSRYRSSLNADVWTRQQAQALPALTVRPFGPGTARPVGDVVHTTGGWYVTFGAATFRSTNLGGTGTITGTQIYASAATHMAQIGDRVYCRFTDNRIGRVTVGGTTVTLAAAPHPDGADGVGAAIGRLFGWDRVGGLYEVHADDTTTLIWTHPWATAGWRWAGVIDTPSGGIAWGSGPGGGSEMYRLFTDDTGAVATPTFIGSVPTGETIDDLLFLQGTLVIGTNLGFRIGQVSDGVTYGPLVPVRYGVHHLCGDGRWVLFGWMGYEPLGYPDEPVTGVPRYSGLGRIDLSTFTSPLVPAYAPDLMVQSTAMIVACDVDTANDQCVVLFDDGGNGARDRSRAPSTPVFINTGRIRYGVFDPKLFTSVDPRTEPLAEGASVEVLMSTDTHPEPVGVGTLVGFGLSGPGDPFVLPTDTAAEWLELRFDFEVVPTPEMSPVLLRWLLRAIPNPRKAEEIVLPLRLFDLVTTDGDAQYTFDVVSELKWLREQCRVQATLTYNDGVEQVLVVINNMQEKAVNRTWANNAWQGIVTLQLRTVI